MVRACRLLEGGEGKKSILILLGLLRSLLLMTGQIFSLSLMNTMITAALMISGRSGNLTLLPLSLKIVLLNSREMQGGLLKGGIFWLMGLRSKGPVLKCPCL